MGCLSVQAGPRAACAGGWGWELTGRATEAEPDMLLSPSLLDTATLLPGPLCIPCSLPIWQLLQGMFLVPCQPCRPGLRSRSWGHCL